MKNQKNKGKYLFVLLATILAVLALDRAISYSFGSLTLAPPLAIIGLGILAALFSWRKVLVAVPIFCVLSYLLIVGDAKYPEVRALSVGLAGVLAAWAAFQRNKLVVQAGEVGAVLENLPLPWVLSDEFGNINQISPRALQLVSLEDSSIVGTSYFSIFTPREEKGELIRKYLDLFGASAKPFPVTLSSSRAPGKKFKARLAALEVPNGKRILTLLEPKE